MFDIQEALKQLPLKPGVYIMKDGMEHIIYVGKAIRLRQRVRQYFQESTNHSPKIKRMVEQIQSFEVIVTDSELEALILECNLIKEHKPKYNTMLKDDKMYPYLKVTVHEPYPRVIYTRTLKKDGGKYFGPYTNASAAKDTIELIRKIWGLRTCNRVLPRDEGKERPCLYYHIKQCDAPCQGYISVEDYHEKVQQVLAFLSGKNELVIANLEAKMLAYSEDLAFEKAAEYRDYIQSVKIIAEKQKIIGQATGDQDIIAFAKEGDQALVQVYFIRNGKMMGREQFKFNDIVETNGQDLMNTFLKQFYTESPYIPKEVVLQDEVDEAAIIASWLSGKRGQKVQITVPKKGDKNKLMALAKKNAAMTLDQFGTAMTAKEKQTKGALLEVVNAMGLDPSISRIEAYDISNTSGVQSVGAMVVFADGAPIRNAYRKFKIKTVYGPNDYASLEEVLTRRFTHALEEQKAILLDHLDPELGRFSKLPDLIMMDGGKGQVNIGLKVLEKLGLEIPVCGMVKDDKHQTRGIYYNNKEILLDSHKEGFRLITRIQDEVHRFAIAYHRQLRGKEQVQSILETIPSVGPNRRKKLLLEFKSVKAIEEADVSTLAKVVPYAVAQKIWDYFHENTKKNIGTDEQL